MGFTWNTSGGKWYLRITKDPDQTQVNLISLRCLVNNHSLMKPLDLSYLMLPLLSILLKTLMFLELGLFSNPEIEVQEL